MSQEQIAQQNNALQVAGADGLIAINHSVKMPSTFALVDIISLYVFVYLSILHMSMYICLGVCFCLYVAIICMYGIVGYMCNGNA